MRFKHKSIKKGKVLFMMMENCGITPVYNVDGNNNNGAWGDGGWTWIIFLFFLMAWGGGWNNGWGGAGVGSNSPGFQGYATRADINEGFLFNNVQNGVQAIQTELCNGFATVNSNISNGFANTNLGMCQGFNGVQQQMAQLGYNLQDCCCQTQRAIDGVNYNNAKNTSDIIQANNANTQRILDTITSDKIDNLRTELQSAQLALQNNAQTQTLINQLRPCPIPAYLSCSPYASYYPTSFANGCGCGNGCC